MYFKYKCLLEQNFVDARTRFTVIIGLLYSHFQVFSNNSDTVSKYLIKETSTNINWEFSCEPATNDFAIIITIAFLGIAPQRTLNNYHIALICSLEVPSSENSNGHKYQDYCKRFTSNRFSRICHVHI